MTKDKTIIDPEELVDLRFPTEPRLGPRGDNVVYTIKERFRKGDHSTSAIWTAEVGKEHSARQLTSGQFQDRSAQYSPDGESVAFLSDRAKAGTACVIYLLSIKGGEAYAITPPENEKAITQFQWSPDGRSIAYLASKEKTDEEKRKEKDKDDAKVYGEMWPYRNLKLLHVKTRTIETLVEGDFQINSLVWKHDGKSIVYLTTVNPDPSSAGYHGVGFEMVSLVDKNTTKFCHFPGPVSGAPVWCKDDEVLFRAGATPTISNTSSTIYKAEISKGEWSVVAFGQKNDAPELVNAKPGPDGFAVFQVAEGLFDTLRINTNDEICSGDGEYNILDFDSVLNGDKLITAAVMSSNCAPWELFCKTYSRSDRSITSVKLTNHCADIDSKYSRTTIPFYCQASDGESLDAVYIKPSDSKEDKPSLPTVVLIHGGPYHRSTLTFDPSGYTWAPLLVSSGYAVLCPNYRGGSAHGDAFASHAEGGMGTKDYSDVIDIVKAAISKGLVHPDKVLVGGWSQGGFLSYLCSTRSDFLFKGAICGAGVTDWDLMCITSDLPWFEAGLAGKAPWIAGAKNIHARHGSAIWHMTTKKKEEMIPMLLLHGELDKRVPITQAIGFHRGCLELDWPCEFVRYPREEHGFVERAHLLDMLKRVAKFVDLHIN